MTTRYPGEGPCRAEAQRLLDAIADKRMTAEQARAEVAAMPEAKAAEVRHWLNRWRGGVTVGNRSHG
ncbi:MAG: hypothetical protein II007_13485 [Gammaproteobacteria bacterium]|nr:hypothetical protein [Gammaproteobacteria bacterium]